MSAQGGTLQSRRTIELPIWPVAVLVVATVAAAIGMTLLNDAGRTTFVTSVTDIERLANSTAAVREQGATLPATVAPSLPSQGFAGFENPGAYITEAPAYAPGLENPGAYPVEIVAPSLPSQGFAGFENPGAYPAEIVAPAMGPVIVNGEPCMQCR
jgi:hypothetical protein